MSSERPIRAPAASPTAVLVTSASAPASGRLAVLSVYAAAAGLVPIPLVPDRLIARVRGAVAHDIASRHGLSLTSDARAVLAAPSTDRGARLFARKVAQAVVRRLLARASLGTFNGALRGVEVFALGHLFERYVTAVRRSGAVRVHAEEARKVRAAIDRAIVRAISPMLQPSEIAMASGVEDLRDELTRWVDAVLLTGAALPGYLERRLEAAFDEVVEASPELHDE